MEFLGLELDWHYWLPSILTGAIYEHEYVFPLEKPKFFFNSSGLLSSNLSKFTKQQVGEVYCNLHCIIIQHKIPAEIDLSYNNFLLISAIEHTKEIYNKI